MKKQRDIENKFLSFFNRKGFTSIEPHPLVPISDETVFFTNSVSTALKGYLKDDTGTLPSNGVCLVQPCLRFQQLSKHLDENFDPKYLTYFEMIGGGIGPKGITYAKRICIEFLISEFGISQEKIKILTTAQDRVFHDGYGRGVEIELDTEPEEYYRWRYGDENLTGSGLTFALQRKDGTFLPVGNLIEMKKNGHIVGYEIAFGVETLLLGKGSLASIFQTAATQHIISSPQTATERKFCDALVGAVAIASAGIEPDYSKRGKIYRKILRNLHFLAEELSFSEDTVKAYMKKVANTVFTRSDFVEKMSVSYRACTTEQKKIVLSYERYVERQSKISKSLEDKELSSIANTCFDKGEAHYIPPYLRKRIIKKHLKKGL